MSKLEITLGMLLVGFAPVVAQKTIAVPTKGLHLVGGSPGLGMIVPHKKWLPTRQQCLYEMKELPTSPILIREVAFEPNAPWPLGLEAAVVTLTLDMSLGPRSPRKFSRTFALNHGKKIARVFLGKIQLPKITKNTKQDWYFRIPLQKPFIADKKIGPSLVLDFSVSSVITKMNGGWEIVQGQKDMGANKFQGIGYSCHFQKIRILWQDFPGSMYVGSKWRWTAAPLLANQPGFFTIGDAGWGSRWGGSTLPIDLKPFGAPGCTWDVRPVLSFPFVISSQGGAVVTGLQIPNDPRLANVKFFTQGAYAYPKANALGWLILPSLEWRIGSGEHHGAIALAGLTINGVPPGKVANWMLMGNPVPYCRITYN